MKIKLSKNQWEFIGKKAGWMKTAVKVGMSKNVNVKWVYIDDDQEGYCEQCNKRYKNKAPTHCPTCGNRILLMELEDTVLASILNPKTRRG